MLTKMILFLTTTCCLSFGFASDITLQARAYNNSCDYYSTTKADFKISYKNETLPWGTKIFLISALNGIDQRTGQAIEWNTREEKEVQASEPFVWTTDLTKQIAARSSPLVYNQLVFLFHIVLPSGESIYDMGSPEAWSYYAARWPARAIPCVTSAEDRPDFLSLNVTPVKR